MTIRRFGQAVLAAALALAAYVLIALLPAAPASAQTVTYPQLNPAITVQDTDLIATWRASGPLTKVQASVLEAYIQGKLSPLFLAPANNLSDLANVGTARTNLGLGSAALATIGTSGTALCQLNANCTWAGTEAFNAKVTHGASTAAGAMFNLTPGVAPTTPVNGDLWGTSASVFVQVNGVTHQLAFLDSSIAGNAATATKLATARTIGTSGDISCSATSFDGSAPITLPNCNLPSSGVGAGTYGDAGHVAQVTVDAKGRVTGASSVAVTPELPSMAGNAGAILTNNGSSASWAPRANAYFSGCSVSGCSLYEGSGIPSVTRNSVGNYFVNFSPSMPDTNYTIVCIPGTASGPVTCMDNSCPNNGCTHPTTGVDIQFYTGAGAAVDPAGFNIIVIHN